MLKERPRVLDSTKNENELIEVWSRKRVERDGIWPYEKKIFSKLLQIASDGGKILEVGVGEGRVVRELQKSGVTADFYSLDITDKVFLAPGHRIKGDARSLPFRDNAFDLVYSIGVVEHFRETFESIREHARVANEGGYVLIFTPRSSLLGIFKRIRFFVGKVIKKWKGNFMTYVGKHLKLDQMELYFHKAGLRILLIEAIPPVTPFPEPFERWSHVLLRPKKYGGFAYCLGQKMSGISKGI